METFTEKLAGFADAQWQKELPENVQSECKRLLLNNLAASAEAQSHRDVAAILSWLTSGTNLDRTGTVLWHSARLPSEQAAFMNAVQMELPDFSETHLGVIAHPMSVIAPAVLAEGEVWGRSGADVLKALAIGVEIDLGLAASLRPSAHARGLGLMAPGSAGAAVAAGLLRVPKSMNLASAIGLALASGTGFSENLGSTAHAYSAGCACRDGVAAAYIAELGVTATRTVFEGWQGMLHAYSEETLDKAESVLATLGKHWRLLEMNYKLFPTETITQAPIQGILGIARETPTTVRASVIGIEVNVSPRVAVVEQHRYERFGSPQTGLQAQFDMRYCVAAAWLAGDFGAEQKKEIVFTDKEVLSLRERVRLVSDDTVSLHDGAQVTVLFADGTHRREDVERFHGTVSDPLTDVELTEKFMKAAARVRPAHSDREAIVDAAFGLDKLDNIVELTALLADSDG